ncbi:MAG: endolytic transglycosylase MltG [Candidatus Methylacidiphilales bacterium]
MKNYTISWRYVSIIIGLLLIFAVYKFTADLFLNNINAKIKTPSFIYIKSNQSFDRLMFNLEKDEILKNSESFERVAKLLNLQEKIKPGRYQITDGLSNIELIKILKSGRQVPVNLVIKYAKRKENLAFTLAKQLELDSNEVLALLNDSNTLQKAKMDSNNIISLFVPNTYNVYWNITSNHLVDRMIKEYNTFWNSSRTTKCILMKMTPLQVANLASIVMSETNKVDEMPIVARTYLNRIKVGMPLQADPTVLFALNDTSIRRVLSIHTALNSPFNTYLNKGLPPGPICMASTAAIDAVLNAPLHNYLYFCAREDFSGYHNFAETFAQHQVNARKYQQELNRRGY